MQLIHFFTAYFLFLLASSVAITAFFCITRGETEIMPDGTERRYGKVLKGYYFFWFREKGKKRIYYVGDQLATLVTKIKEHFAAPVALTGDPFTPTTIKAFETNEDIKDAIPALRNLMQVQFSAEALGNENVRVTVWEEEPEYVFPLWLRTVMAGCITCTPTVYGNITYWISVYVFRKSVLYDALFGCFNNEQTGIIVVWIAYWLSLAWLNTVLWNIYDR